MNALKMTTPAGVAVYPHLNDPDFMYKKEGSYHTKLRLYADEPETEAFITMLEDYIDRCWDEQIEILKAAHEALNAKRITAGKKPMPDFEDPKQCDSPIKPDLDEDKVATGDYLLNVKMAAMVAPKGRDSWEQKPKFFDGTGQTMRNVPRIGGGSKLKIALEAIPFFTEQIGVGVSLRLKAVQVIDLVEGFVEGETESFGFAAVSDGYKSDEFDAGSTKGDF